MKFKIILPSWYKVYIVNFENFTIHCHMRRFLQARSFECVNTVFYINIIWYNWCTDLIGQLLGKCYKSLGAVEVIEQRA